MKHLNKKRYASLLIVVLLLFGIITALTGCMNEDSTNDVYQSDIKVKDATSEFYVNDYGNILSSEQRTELVKRAKALNEDYNGIQLVITTLESLDGYSIEEYATAMYNKFGIGTKDMGALILFSSGDRQVRIEVGRGMEEYMTDADAGALIDEYAIDYFKNDQFADGIVALQKAVVTFIKNEVPVEWNSALGDEQTSKNTSDVAQSIDESVNTVQAVDNSDVKNSSIADEQSDSGFPMLFWMFVIVVPYGIALGLLYSSVKKYKALRQKNEEMVNENSVQIKHYKYTIDEMEQDAWDIKAEYQKKYNEYEKKLKNCQREKDELKKLIEKMQETHARAIVLHPRLEDEIIEMIENEHKAEAKKVDDAIQSALTNKASKENVDVFGNALAKYNSASMEAKGYVRSDIKVLNQLYEQSSALQKEFQNSTCLEFRFDMPLNLIKTYNSLLELDAFDEEERNASLMGIFKRDFVDSGNYFRQKKVLPTLSQGKNTLSIFFNHLVTMEDRLHRERIYDRNRAVRLHWIKYHLEERQPEHLQVFSVKDKVAIRTYLYDVQESYVIVLEPRGDNRYYLLTAYYLLGRNRYKIEHKLKRRLAKVY